MPQNRENESNSIFNIDIYIIHFHFFYILLVKRVYKTDSRLKLYMTLSGFGANFMNDRTNFQ